MASLNEVSAVRKVMEKYIEGSYTADVPLLKSIFHPDALMSGYYEGELGIGSPEPFFAELMEATSSKDAGDAYAGEVVFIHIDGDIASAAIAEDNLFGLNYMNHFHLLKVDGEWLIVSKVYTIVD